MAGSDIGARSRPWISVVDARTGAVLTRFLAYEPGFRGGVRPTLGDVDRDGVDEIVVAPGPGRRGEIRVFELDGTERTAYRTFAYGRAYRAGIELAVGNVDAVGGPEIVTAASRGPGLVRVFAVNPSAADPVADLPLRSFRALPGGLMAGATVATADIGTFMAGVATAPEVGDGRMEIVVGTGVGAAPRAVVYDVSATPTVVRRIAWPTAARGGISVSAGRYDGDTLDDVVVAGGRNARSVIEVRSGRDPARVLVRQTAFAGLATASLPVHAGVLDLDGDGRAEALVASQGSGPGQGLRLVRSGGSFSAFSTLGGALRIATTAPRAAG